MSSVSYETRCLLAAAYVYTPGKQPVYLTHSVRIEDGRETLLCRRAKSENIADQGAHTEAELLGRPTCKTCAKRDPRFAPLPRPDHEGP